MARHLARASLIAATSLVALVILGTGTAAAQNAAAEALFTDGERLLKAGQIAQACDAFEASNRLEPRAGTLINLGTCREQNQQLASAWSAFKDALSRVKDPKKKKIAQTKVTDLEPRLSYLTITVPDGSKVAGLTITRDGAPIDPALWNRSVPTDGGTFTIAASAPDHEAWTTTVVVPAEKGQIAVEVPRPAEVVKAAAPVPDAPPPVPTAPVVEDRPVARGGGTFTGRRKAAIGVLVLGVGAGAAGVLLGRQASQAEDDAYALCPDPQAACPDAVEANALIDKGRSRALLANISYGVAGAAAITAVVLWITGAPASPEARVAVTPRLGDVAGLDLAVRF